MKKMINNITKLSKSILVLTIIFLFASLNLFAQGEPFPIDFQASFATLTAFIVVIPIVVEFIKKIIPEDFPSLLIQIVSWVTGIGLAMTAWVLNLGFFAELSQWYEALAVGIGSSLVANGVFDTGLITWALNLAGIKTRKKST